MKKVLSIFYDFPPSAAPGGKRAAALYRDLPEMGWQPIVITVPTKTYDALDEMQRPDEGESVFAVHTNEPVRIKRIAQPYKLLRPLWFAAYPWLWERHALWLGPVMKLAKELATKHRFSALLTSSNPYVALQLGCQLKSVLQLPWLADLRDPYTLSPMKRWPSYLHYRIMQRYEAKWLSQADAISVVTPTMKDDLLRSFPNIHQEKVVVAKNGFPEGEFKDISPVERDSKEVFTIVYAGTLRYEQEMLSESLPRWLYRCSLDYYPRTYDFSTRSPKTLFKSLQLLKKQQPDIFARIRVRVLGASDPRNKKLADDLEVASAISFEDRVGYDTSIEAIKGADLLYLPMEKRLGGGRSAYMSTKVYEYIASCRPIAVVGDACDSSDLVEEAGCGKRFDIGDDRALADELVRLISGEMGGYEFRQSVIEQHTRQKTAIKLAETLNRIHGGA